MSGDPPRLLDSGEGSDLLRRGLEAARGDGLTASRLARIGARLPLDAPVGRSGQGSPSAPTKLAPVGSAAATPSVLSGLGIGAALGAIIVGAVWLMPSPTKPLPEPRPAVAVAAATASAAPTVEAPVPAEPPAPPPRAPEPETPRPAANIPPPMPPSSTQGAPPGGPTEAAPAAAETETSLLQRAQEALASRPAEALALTDAHRARFPGGVLAQEREVIAVSALLSLGRGDEARARADRFIAGHPSSAYRRRLEVLVPALKNDPR